RRYARPSAAGWRTPPRPTSRSHTRRWPSRPGRCGVRPTTGAGRPPGSGDATRNVRNRFSSALLSSSGPGAAPVLRAFVNRVGGGRAPTPGLWTTWHLTDHSRVLGTVLLSHRSARYRWTAAPAPARAARTRAAGTARAAAPGGPPACPPPPEPGRCGGPGCSLRPPAAAAPERRRRPRPAPTHGAGPAARRVRPAKPQSTTRPAAAR